MFTTRVTKAENKRSRNTNPTKYLGVPSCSGRV